MEHDKCEWMAWEGDMTHHLKTTPAAQSAKLQLTAFSVSPPRFHICLRGFSRQLGPVLLQ